MLTYRLPLFLDYLAHHYTTLYSRYVGRLIELFPSSDDTDTNLVIVHDETDTKVDDERIIELWKHFKED